MSPARIEENCTEQEWNETAIRNGLLQYNIAATDGLLLKPGIGIKLFVRNEEGQVVGGIVCETYMMCMEIGVLWVEKAYQGQGFGYQLIAQAERRAKEAGCLFSHTSTYSFQSPDFYKRQGYEVYASLDGFPGGVKLYSLKKKL